MELINVKIENFRSLDELDFKFLPKCRVLVGINESGKSNILKALSMLDNDKTPTPSDIREANEDEIVEDAFVEFIFELNKEEIDENYENVKEQIAGLDKKEEIVKNSKDKKISLKILSEKYKKGVYHVDIIKGEKKSQYYTYNSHSLLPNWKKITDQCPADYICKTEAGEEIKLKEKKLINIDNFEEISTEYIEDAEFKDLQKILGSKVCNCIDENLPEVLFWEYDEKNVLPPKININQFKEDPNTCLPLKYMFHLHGIEDIKASIEGSQKTDKGFRNLLNRIAKQSTSHLHSVWKEYKKVQFELLPNGENIDAGIKDEYNSFEFAQRSDGFKRFVSFLLMVSTKVKSDLLNNAVLLIDEPDSGLHPSGARFLRDELIKISKNNYVVYSSHSIFMIDRKNISRHLIVEKNKEITNIKTADESNIIKEEVIYNALGFSFFETLKEKNILFEGWRDEILFEKATQKIPSKYLDLKNNLKEIGTCYGYGVKSMAQITPLLKLANREAFIVSDNDKPAKDKKKEYEKNNGYGYWFTYEDIDSELKAITGEDFIKISIIIDILSKIKDEKGFDIEISESDFTDPKGRLYIIDKWLIDNGIAEKEDRKEIINNIKDEIFSDLKYTHIEEYYYDFLINTIKKINEAEK